MNHRNLKIALASAALAVSGAAMADGPAWSFVQGQAGWGDCFDDCQNTRYGASGSVALFNAMHLALTFTTGKLDEAGADDVDVDVWEGRVGGHFGVSDNADVFAEARLGNVDAEGGGDEDYYGGAFGVRVMLTDNVEVNGGAEALYADDSESNFVSGFIGGRYNFTDAFSFGVTYTDDNLRYLDQDSLDLDLRWSFADFGWLGND